MYISFWEDEKSSSFFMYIAAKSVSIATNATLPSYFPHIICYIHFFFVSLRAFLDKDINLNT